jgi:Uma2 family endonuclease
MSTAEIPKRFAMNASVTVSVEDRLADLGGIPLSRVLAFPAPGSATLADLIEARRTDDRLSLLAMVLIQWLRNHLDVNPIGVVTRPGGATRLFDKTVRAADVAFFRWERMSEGKLPTHPVPELVPDFVVEVLSISKTRGEMARKRREYFQAGVRLVWMVDPQSRTVAVYTDPESFSVASEEDIIDGRDVLPGWKVDLGRLFASKRPAKSVL